MTTAVQAFRESDRFALQQRSLALTAPSPAGAMRATAMPTPAGAEFLCGYCLTDQVREALHFGGCTPSRLQAAILAAWEAAPKVPGQTVELEIIEGLDGLELEGPGQPALKLVTPDFWYAYTFDGVQHRIPMALPPTPAAPDFWRTMPEKAHMGLVHVGLSEPRFNAAVGRLLQKAMAKRNGGIPVVALPVPLVARKGAYKQAEALRLRLQKVGA